MLARAAPLQERGPRCHTCRDSARLVCLPAHASPLTSHHVPSRTITSHHVPSRPLLLALLPLLALKLPVQQRDGARDHGALYPCIAGIPGVEHLMQHTITVA